MSQNELFHDACVIIEQAQKSAYLAVNETLIKRNWLLGMRIQHEVLKDQRAEYGKQLVRKLSILLVGRYDNSFSERNLYHFIDFYRLFPDFFLRSEWKTCRRTICERNEFTIDGVKK